ncbi:MAG: hypothetical protein PCFJNLEI_00461 [Verrucomicrobiae bacterium]|nr:hypothetical protein [Verrucomicrobiae bacterium]
MPAPTTIEQLLPPSAKEALRHLELHARRSVDGLRHGVHRSRRSGVSTDFDHHKNYVAGDPLKHIDWKASARHDRFYVKRYVEETALAVRLVVDRSGSMLQATDGVSKYEQACRLAASLAYLVIKERDAAGLALAAAREIIWLPAGASDTHLVRILDALVANGAGTPDNLSACLRAIRERAERRGLVVVITDLLFDPLPVQRELGRLQAQGHEVLLFQVRDATEEEFPFNRWAQFHCLENPAVKHRLDTVPLKRIYREEYQALLADWRAWTKQHGMDFVSFRTTDRVERVLADYLADRVRVAR